MPVIEGEGLERPVPSPKVSSAVPAVAARLVRVVEGVGDVELGPPGTESRLHQSPAGAVSSE
ncbi:hypothetical protein [Streptomyces sp. NBC_01538]|uniref:hypothetical protein n=1 Tax=Streptomyces sp. NBC_01538 TaxID=2903897 RepID=UPI003868FC74